MDGRGIAETKYRLKSTDRKMLSLRLLAIRAIRLRENLRLSKLRNIVLQRGISTLVLVPKLGIMLRNFSKN